MCFYILSTFQQMDKKTTIKTVDADVLILSISIFYKLKDHLEELWIDFGTGKNRRFFSVPEIY